MSKKQNHEESPKGSPAMSPKRRLVRDGVAEAHYKGGSIARKKATAMEDHRAHKTSIGRPPLLRGTRAPGGGTHGGPHRQG